VKRVTAALLFLVVTALVSSKTAVAYDVNSTGSAVVSATILSTTFNPPILVAPVNNSSTNNPREPLVWKRPSPLPVTPLHHYDVYVDGQIFAASVSDSVTTQTYYYYTITRINDTFTLNLNSDFAQGYHTWSVTAYNTYGTSAGSETRTYYIDSIAPYITLQKVDTKTLNWSTNNLTAIPDVTLRGLSVNNPNPLLSGTVEPYANMQIVLMCPQNILNCHNQSYLGNYPTGVWQHRFYGLIRGVVYTVHLSATDSAGNSTIFPEFYLAYGLATPTPSAITTPTVSPTISIPPTTTPTLTIEVIPTPFIPAPPLSPTPPIFLTSTPVKTINYLPYLLILLALGLPLHLLMTTFGAKIRFTQIHHFFLILFFPFFKHQTYQTIPFTTLDFFDPDKLDSVWQTAISNINGFYSLKTDIPPKLFTQITSTGRLWKNTILQSNLLSISCLYPCTETAQMATDRLRHLSMTLRSLPLAIACLTSGVCLALSPNYFYLIYLYLSLHLVFTEYLYPRISK
jgi:hypothetical protein